MIKTNKSLNRCKEMCNHDDDDKKKNMLVGHCLHCAHSMLPALVYSKHTTMCSPISSLINSKRK